MKKSLLLSLVTTVALCAAATTAFAEDKNSGLEADTNIGIGFEDGDNSGTDGPFKDNLAMVFRPRSFEFGTSNKAGNTSNTYANKITARQYLVVNDDRNDDQKGAGWIMTGQMSALTSASLEELTNAKLTLGSDTAKFFTYTIGEKMNIDNTDYIPEPVNDNADGSQAPSLSAFPEAEKTKFTAGATTLVAGGGAVEVFKKNVADDQKGGIAYQMENVKLDVVNKESLAGKNFVGTITWVLGKDVLVGP